MPPAPLLSSLDAIFPLPLVDLSLIWYNIMYTLILGRREASADGRKGEACRKVRVRKKNKARREVNGQGGGSNTLEAKAHLRDKGGGEETHRDEGKADR